MYTDQIMQGTWMHSILSHGIPAQRAALKLTDSQVRLVGHNHKILPGVIKKGETIISAKRLIMQIRWQIKLWRS